jgi:hypothetical protein
MPPVVRCTFCLIALLHAAIDALCCILHVLRCCLLHVWVRCIVRIVLQFGLLHTVPVAHRETVGLCLVVCGTRYSMRDGILAVQSWHHSPPARAVGPVLTGEDILVVLAARAGKSIMHSPHVAELCVAC